MELLLVCWGIVWLFQNAAVETKHAALGSTSPRMQMKLERLRQQGKPGYSPRLGSWDWWQALIADMVQAKIEKRRELAAERDRKASEQNLTDHADQAIAVTAPQPGQQVKTAAQQSDTGIDNLTKVQCHRCGQPTLIQDYDPAGGPVVCAPCRRDLLAAKPTQIQPEPSADPEPSGPDAQVIPMFPVPDITNPSQEEVPNMPEANGLDPAIAYAQQTAAAHKAHSAAGGETFINGLTADGVSGETINAIAAAQEASANAAAKWDYAAAKLTDTQKGVQEKYVLNPDAGSREFMLKGR